MPELGVPELLIVAVIVLLLFGPGKMADIGGALGKGIREFRKASNEDGDGQAGGGGLPVAHAAGPDESAGARPKYCIECGAAVTAEQKFCSACGAPTKVAV